MKHNLTRTIILLTGLAAAAFSQQSTVYISVVATKLFVVGGANPMTGLFLQHPSDDTTWSHLGPATIRAFGCAAPAMTQGHILYIAAGNGIHKSTDGGATWKITTSWRMTEVLGVTPDPTDSNIVYAATPYGVFGTTDGCATWRELTEGVTARFTTCVVVQPADPRTLYCATEDGAYRSTDRGNHWQKMALNVQGVRVIAAHPRDAQVLVAGTEENGIYVSHNGGNWWEKAEAGIDHRTFYAIAFDPTHPDTVYAGGYVTGVYKSVDGGTSWKRYNNGLIDLTVHTIAVDPRDGQTVYVGTHGGGVFHTDDGGEHWLSAGRTGSQVWHVEIRP